MSKEDFEEFEEKPEKSSYGALFWLYLLTAIVILAFSSYSSGSTDILVFNVYMVASNKQILLTISGLFSFYFLVLRFLSRFSKLPKIGILVGHLACSALLFGFLFYLSVQSSKFDFSEEINFDQLGELYRINSFLTYAGLSFLFVQGIFTLILFVNGIKRTRFLC